MSRFSSSGEQTFLNHFEKRFDFPAFNRQLINRVSKGERVAALDPGYIPKAGKSTYGKGKSGKIAIKNPDTHYFSLDLSTEEIKIYSAVVFSKAFKRNIKLAVAVFFKDGKEVARKLYFSTDLKLDGEKNVRYYRSRFQIEFLYRDAKQFTGLATCQARSENKLDFHFNAALTAVNLAK